MTRPEDDNNPGDTGDTPPEPPPLPPPEEESAPRKDHGDDLPPPPPRRDRPVSPPPQEETSSANTGPADVPPPPPPPPGAGTTALATYTRAETEAPREAQILGILTLVGGLFSVAFGIGVLVTTCCWLTYLFQIPAGVWGIVHGIRMLNDRFVPPNPALAVFYCLGIAGCDPFSMTCGIALLVLMNQPKVKDYYRSLGVPY